ncbi:MAG TPA: c-type cytochrome [Casimicrobiaceae bacterium]|jgi:cytochrome c553
MATLRAIVVVFLAALAGSTAALAQTGSQLYQQWCQGCHGAPASNEKNVLAGKEWSFIKLAMDTVPQMNDILRPVYDDGLLTDDDFMKIAAYLQTFTGGAISTVTPVVEYYNAGFGHYFMTADDDEITGLDAGAFDFAFLRTGREFDAYSSPVAGTVPVCRFFTTPGTFGTKSSHFYTANGAECEGLKLNPAWVYEKIAFYARVPTNGACGAGTRPIYRMYNNGQTGAPNHRFTSDFPTYQTFTTAQNWSPEGVAFCAPT